MSMFFPVVDKAISRLLTSQPDIVISLYRLTLVITHPIIIKYSFISPLELEYISIKHISHQNSVCKCLENKSKPSFLVPNIDGMVNIFKPQLFK